MWSQSGLMDATALEQLTADGMQAVNQRIQTALRSDVALINQMGSYILAAGGKRMRPRLVLLSARALDYSGQQHADLAAIIEFIHTATLLHDDVVDSSAMRRGAQTANQVWGNEAAVLVGDFLYSRAFEMMVEVGQMRVMEVLAEATNTIAAGEVMQLLNIREPEVSEQQYMDVIQAKTAMLFEAAGRLGAIISGAGDDVERAMASYGRHLGTAFQLVDDVLDYTADNSELGKNTGDDLAEGKPTLPLIYAMRDGTEQTRELLRRCITDAEFQVPLQEVTYAVRETGAIENSMRAAQKQVQAACDALRGVPQSSYRDALEWVARSSIERRS